jgi:serine/threonine-protein kinase
MATVFRGTRVTTGAQVAIKVLAPRYASNRGFVDRFEREAGALAALDHPNIVNVLGQGCAASNYYFAMELVEGVTLDQVIHTIELDSRQHTHLVREICNALAYVHSRGIVHCDMKPGNILVTRDGVVKVSDFGVAHIAGDGAGLGNGPACGTRNYMAPELMSEFEAPNVRADVYSLGVTFYKMFTRQLPAASPDPVSALNPALPVRLDAVVAQALEKEPARRPESVEEFRDALLYALGAA